ncbi:MAG TPA: beta-L-arabinofuranosidase domain-containing protein [Streptosporangiaceae bacterium]|nr:beta-L-arabinofuranosidase domain-containing protein [Streptosporangiaceae bacterium]
MAKTMMRPVDWDGGRLRPLGIDEVRLDGGFWGHRQRLNGEVILDHCESWMERLGWIGNFRDPAAPHRGREFSDSEIYKLLEGLSWEAGRTGDAEFDRRVNRLAETVAAAQEPDGYLNTRWHANRYTDLEWGHELYCYGHLIQAGVARLRSAGDDDVLVGVARRAADHVCREFGASGRQGVCGHPEIEMALVELYRATGQERYLEQARLFVERRGRPALSDIHLGRAYFQDDMPVRRARTFRGHAVRALYLASGAVDVAVETGDDELLAAVIAQWERTIAARTYLTGGMGSRHSGEAFGEDWELPSDRAYAETCAGVASVMLSWRLLLATGDARYADLAERTLYNVVAASPAIDGRAFFYANPLQVRVPGRAPDPDAENPRVESPLRAPWFSVACCPNNLVRTLASLSGYIATRDDDGVQLHQLVPCSVDTTLPDGRRVGLRVETGYPWSGAVTVRVEHTDGGPWRLSMRIPPWAGHGEPGRRSMVEEREWRPGDEVRLDLPMRPRWTRPDPRIDAVRGCVAVERGPLVYCAESLGDEPPLAGLSVDTSVPPAERPADESGLDGVLISVAARTAGSAAGTWPYGDPPPTPAGGNDANGANGANGATLVPYHLWGNRGPATMRVWLPEDSA